MKWLSIYTIFPNEVTVRVPHRWRGESQAKKTFLAPSADNQTRNYDIECLNRHLSLSTLRPKGLSRSKMKWWAIYTNLAMNVIVRLPHPRTGHSLGQKPFLAPSADNQIRNDDIECSNHHPSISSLGPKRLSRRKMKWWAILTNLPVDVKIRLPHPRSGIARTTKRF